VVIDEQQTGHLRAAAADRRLRRRALSASLRKRQRQVHRRAAAGAGGQDHAPAGRLGALAHAAQAEAGGAGVPRQSRAVVLDRQGELLVGAQPDRDARRARVPPCVRQGFLADAQYRALHLERQHACEAVTLEARLDAVLSLH
jgi:hypothetical protein